MAKQTINIGSSANDGTGDPLRTAFDKINDNFTEIYNELGGSTPSNLGFSGNSIISDDTNGNIELDPNGTGKVIINADLEVKGTTSQINATVMQVEDNLVEFNRNSSGADIDAGIYINRGGAGDNAVFYWNEGDDKFKAVTSASAATATAVADTAKATIVANFEGDSLQINTIASTDSSVVTFSEGIMVEGVAQANSLQTDNITSRNSSAVTVGESLIVDGTLFANNIDTNKIVNSDSSAIEFDTDIRGLNVHADTVITSQIYAADSTAVEIINDLDVTGRIRVNYFAAFDSSLQHFNDSVQFENNARVVGNFINEGSTTYGISDNFASSTTALGLSTTVHSLAAGEENYTLADGGEGQVIYFTCAGGGSAIQNTTVTLSKVRNPIDGTIDTSYAWKPFIIPGTTNADSTQAVRTLATAVFGNGAWNVDFYAG